MQPDLRIAYNSGSTASTMLGRSWDFTFPYIQRSTRAGQPTFTWADTFSIRWGGRLLDLHLICDEDSGCPPGIREYRTEIETFIRVRSITIIPFLTYWEVQDGSGRTYQFGNGLATNTWAQVDDFQWALDRVEDSHGNYLTIEWLANAGVLYPREIKYAGNSVSGLEPTNRVQFDYEERTDVNETRMGMKPSFFGRHMRYRLRRLKTWAGSQVASVYIFTYNTPTTGLVTDLCAGVTCGSTTILCDDGQYASCQQTCTADSGFCSPCQPACGGGGGDCDNPPCRHIPPDGDPSGPLAQPIPPSLLLQVLRWDGDGTTLLPATTFGYREELTRDYAPPISDVPVQFGARSSDRNSISDYGAVLAEVNGDGLPDLIVGRASDDPGAVPRTGAVYINVGGSWVPDPTYVVPPGAEFVFHAHGDDFDNGARAVDINGDGLDDLVRAISLNAGPNMCTGLFAAVWINNGHGWTPATVGNSGLPGVYSVPIAFASCLNRDGEDLGVRFGDVNGDGLVDLLKRWDLDGNIYAEGVYLNTGHGWVLRAGWHVPEPLAAHEHDTYDPGTRVLDVNGDGLVDIVRSYSWNGVTQPPKVYLGMGTPNANGQVWQEDLIFDWWFPEVISSVNVGDETANSTDLGVRFGDVNGDGLIDILRSYQEEQSVGPDVVTKKVYLHHAGMRWAEDASWGPALRYTFVRKTHDGPGYDEGVRVVDVDGNGTVDFVKSFDDGGGVVQERSTSNDSITHLLSSTTNGIGGATTLSYLPSTAFDNHDLAAPLGSRAYLPFAIPVLSAVTMSDGQAGIGHSFTTSYSYRGGYFHTGRREFRGFRYVQTDLPGGRTYSEQLFVQDTGLDVSPLMGSVERQALRRVSDGRVFSATINTFDRSDGMAPFVHWLARSDNYLFDWGVNVPIESLGAAGAVKKTATAFVNSFDANGLINLHETQSLGDLATADDDLYALDEYVNDTTNWWVGLVKRRYATDGPGGTGTRQADSWLYYDNQALGQIGAKGELTKVERWTGSENVARTFGYDSTYGLPTSRTDEENHVVNLNYGLTDPTFTFVDRTWATTTGGGIPVQHQTTYTYDPRFGTVTNATSTGSGSVWTEYDGFGRPTKSWTALDSPTLPSVCYQYALSSRPVRISRFVRETSGLGEACGTSGMIATASYVDGLGRTIETKSESGNSAYQSNVSGVVIFDGEGRVQSSKRPFFSTDAVLTYTAPPSNVPETTFGYDEVARLLTTTMTDLPVMTRSYSGWTEAECDLEHRRTEADRDAFGRIVRARTYSGTCGASVLYTTTTHEYDRQGRLRVIKDTANNSVMAYGYDNLDRMTSASDIDGGTVGIEYYKNGSLYRTIDAENRIRTYDSYDELGRLLHVTRTQGTETAVRIYRYDESSGGLGAAGKLTSVEDLSSGVREEFVYDLMGRQTTSRKRLDEVWYDVSATLDTAGRPRSITYPGFQTIEYAYGADGAATSIPGFVGNVVRDADGALTHLEYANGMAVDRTYDPTRRWLTNIRARALAPSSPEIVNSSYGYSPGGHLLSITDLVGTASATFALDHLYRLTTATGLTESINYSHDALGNLTGKGASTFLYEDPSHPHQATSMIVGGLTGGGDDGGATSSLPSGTEGGMPLNDDLNLGYDYTGNVKSVTNAADDGWLYEYNVDGRMSLAHYNPPGDWTSFAYDPEGLVTKRINHEAGTDTTTIFLGDLYEETAGASKSYVYFEGMRVAEWRSDGSKYFYLNDHLGGLNVVTDGQGTVVQRVEYKPYGEVSSIQSATFATLFTYAGAKKGGLSGIYDFGARFYDPVLGRFLSTDPILANPLDPRNLNPYGYALGNPVEMVDIGGFSVFPAFNAFAGFVVGAFVTGVTYGCVPCGAAAGGAVSGALAASETGGNTTIGAISGGVVGGLTGWAMNGFSAYPPVRLDGTIGNMVSSARNDTVVRGAADGVGASLSEDSLPPLAVFTRPITESALTGGVYGAAGGGVATTLLAAAQPAWSATAASGGTGPNIQVGLASGQRPDLGVIGNAIRNQVDSPIEKDLFEHYWLGRGSDVQLSAQQFGRVVAVVTGLPQPHAQRVALGSSVLVRRQFDFPPGEFNAAFGTASVFYDVSGHAVGFYDRYNFDVRWRGKWDPTLRVIGVRVGCAVAGNCVSFDVTYGQFVRP